jgi:hypothetical protein
MGNGDRKRPRFPGLESPSIAHNDVGASAKSAAVERAVAFSPEIEARLQEIYTGPKKKFSAEPNIGTRSSSESASNHIGCHPERSEKSGIRIRTLGVGPVENHPDQLHEEKDTQENGNAGDDRIVFPASAQERRTATAGGSGLAENIVDRPVHGAPVKLFETVIGRSGFPKIM